MEIARPLSWRRLDVLLSSSQNRAATQRDIAESKGQLTQAMFSRLLTIFRFIGKLLSSHDVRELGAGRPAPVRSSAEARLYPVYRPILR
jgi:hypothetical protein